MADAPVDAPAAAPPVSAPVPAPAPAAAAPSAPSPSPAAVSSAAPVKSTPAASADAPASTTPSPEPVAATEAPAPDAPVQPARSFLSEIADKNAPKPVETKPAESAPESAQVDKPAEAAAAPPEKIAWEYAVPEEVSLNPEGTLKAKVQFDEKAKAHVDSMLEAFAAKPGDKANQQALVDFHIERLKEQQRQQADFNKNFWANTRADWRKEWAADPEIGGSGIETTKGAIARVLDIAYRHSDTSAANKAFHRQVEAMFETTGAGDHPALGKIFARLARFMAESPPPPPNISPPKDISKPPGRRGKLHYESMS